MPCNPKRNEAVHPRPARLWSSVKISDLFDWLGGSDAPRDPISQDRGLEAVDFLRFPMPLRPGIRFNQEPSTPAELFMSTPKDAPERSVPARFRQHHRPEPTGEEKLPPTLSRPLDPADPATVLRVHRLRALTPTTSLPEALARLWPGIA
jgi:hypothetical protein